MKTYTINACEKLIDNYINNYNGTLTPLKEGILGLGTILLHSGKNAKTILIKEIYLNEWSSAHTVKMYSKMPTKYKTIIQSL